MLRTIIDSLAAPATPKSMALSVAVGGFGYLLAKKYKGDKELEELIARRRRAEYIQYIQEMSRNLDAQTAYLESGMPSSTNDNNRFFSPKASIVADQSTHPNNDSELPTLKK